MSAVSPDATASARDIEMVVLRAIADKGQKATAERVGMTDTRLSRWKDSKADGGVLDLAETASVLAALGLRVIPVDANGTVTVAYDIWMATNVLAREHTESVTRGGK